MVDSVLLAWVLVVVRISLVIDPSPFCFHVLFHSAVDYKGFRVVVFPLPESVPEVIAWPQPLSARVRHVSH